MLDSIVEAMEKLHEKRVIKLVKYAMAKGYSEAQVIESIQRGLDEIGRCFEKGKYGVTDLMMAGIIFKEILEMDYFRVQVDESDSEEKIGTILICTIQEDLHDIGKTIFKNMAILAGMYVIDIGVDVTPQEIVDKTKTFNPEIIGISSILTTGIEYIKQTNEMLIETGLRENVKIIIGGLSSLKNVVEYTGVDAYGKDAFEGAKICRQWLQGRE